MFSGNVHPSHILLSASRGTPGGASVGPNIYGIGIPSRQSVLVLNNGIVNATFLLYFWAVMIVVIKSLSCICFRTTGVLNGASFTMIILNPSGSFGTKTGGEGSRASMVNLGSSTGNNGGGISDFLLLPPQNPFFFGMLCVTIGKRKRCSLRANISPCATCLGGSIGKNANAASFLIFVR